VSWVDSFDLPSVFDHRGALYKEWHDFVFFDRRIGLFGLLNFAVLGNPHDEKRGYGAALTFLVAQFTHPYSLPCERPRVTVGVLL